MKDKAHQIFRSTLRCRCGSGEWVSGLAGTEGESDTVVWCLGCWPWLSEPAGDVAAAGDLSGRGMARSGLVRNGGVRRSGREVSGGGSGQPGGQKKRGAGVQTRRLGNRKVNLTASG